MCLLLRLYPQPRPPQRQAGDDSAVHGGGGAAMGRQDHVSAVSTQHQQLSFILPQGLVMSRPPDLPAYILPISVHGITALSVIPVGNGRIF